MDEKGRTGSWLTWSLALKLGVIALCFTAITVLAAANFGVVEVRLLVFSIETRLVWALLAAAGLGFSIGLLTNRLKE